MRLLLHSIAFGNLKLLAPERRARPRASLGALAAALGLAGASGSARRSTGSSPTASTSWPRWPSPPPTRRRVLDEEDLARTIDAMGTSLLDWTQALLARGLFADDARVLGLTSEGNPVAWKGYAAVAAAKVALESVARAMAVELAPYGMRANVVQAGVTDTPALRAIPGHDASAGAGAAAQPVPPPDHARGRRATSICLLATDEAAWINGEVIRVDGGEHVSGAHRLMLHLHGLGHFHPENEITNALPGRARHRHHRRVDPGARRHPLAAHDAAARLHPHDAQPRPARGRRGGALHARRDRSPRGRDGASRAPA